MDTAIGSTHVGTPTRAHASSHAHTFQWRAFVSLSLIVSGVVVLLSGVLLLLAPSGRLALAGGWSALGIDRQGWVSLHDVFGLLWIPLLLAHAVLNRKPILCYLKDRARKAFTMRPEAVAAVALTLVLAVLAVTRVLPLGVLHGIGGQGLGR